MRSTDAEHRRARLVLNRVTLPRFGSGRRSPPIVVAIEGPNGAGKTTLCHSLARALGVPFCLGTDPAWFTDTLKARMIRDAEWHASALFFLSGCFEQMRLLRQRPQLLVIMDRCFWSTLAVHASQDPQRLRALVALLQPLAPCIEVPQLTLVLEASFATCQTRIAKKPALARALDELNATEAFHAREHEFYRWLSRRTANVIFLNVDEGTVEQVAEWGLQLVRENVSGFRSAVFGRKVAQERRNLKHLGTLAIRSPSARPYRSSC
jgi:thymidylate kinase